MDALENRSNWSETEQIGLSRLLGKVRRDVEIVEALISQQGWRAVDLAAISGRSRSFCGASGRFGRVADITRNNPETVQSSPVADCEHTPQRRPRRVVRIARMQPEAVDRTSIKRRNNNTIDEYSHAPVVGISASVKRIQPLSAPRDVAWQPAPGAINAVKKLDRSSLTPVIVMMILAWAGILAVGVQIGTTPPSGMRLTIDP